MILGSGSVHNVGKWRNSRKREDRSTAKCQKCLQTGHWTYECKNARVHRSRGSRTDDLEKVGKKGVLSNPTVELPDELHPDYQKKVHELRMQQIREQAAHRRKRRLKQLRREIPDGSESSSSGSESSSSGNSSSSKSSGSSSSSSSSSEHDEGGAKNRDEHMGSEKRARASEVSSRQHENSDRNRDHDRFDGHRSERYDDDPMEGRGPVGHDRGMDRDRDGDGDRDRRGGRHERQERGHDHAEERGRSGKGRDYGRGEHDEERRDRQDGSRRGSARRRQRDRS